MEIQIRLWGESCSSLIPLCFLLLVSLLSVDAANSQTAVAKPSFPANDLPLGGGNSGSFEGIDDTAIQSNPPFAPWNFDSGANDAGISGDESPIAFENPPAPDGVNIAYLLGGSAIQMQETWSAGAYRISLFAAQRITGGVEQEQGFEILVNGELLCSEHDSLTGNFVLHTTRPVVLATMGTVTLEIRATTSNASDYVFIDHVRLESLREWSDPNTWTLTGAAGPLPGLADAVTIPGTSTVALSSAAECKTLSVQGQLMVSNSVASLKARQIDVHGPGAHLEVGRYAVPMLDTSSFNVILYGPYATTVPDPMISNQKFLRARDSGLIDLHGARKTSWTALKQPAALGSDQIVVSDTTGWKIGDKVVIPGAQGQANPGIGTNNYVDYSERFSILNIGPHPNGGYAVDLGEEDNDTVAASLATARIASSQVLGGYDLNQHTEVGVLSRNVCVKSEDTAAGVYSSQLQGTGYGGHVMMIGNGTPADNGNGRFSNVELFELGQTKITGRYPLHWHMCTGPLTVANYAEDCSIYDSFSRAVTVHGTDGVRIEGCVSHKVLGHAMFLEDGSEQGNEFIRNLVISTMRPNSDLSLGLDDALIVSDNQFIEAFQSKSPSSFWITNPNNRFEDNVVADTIGSGYWFALGENVIGLSNDPMHPQLMHHSGDMPRRLDLGSFLRNVAHGCRIGLDIHDGLRPDGGAIPNLSWEPASYSARIEHFKAYSCQLGIYTGHAADEHRLTFVMPILADNVTALALASSDYVEGGLVIADSGNNLYAYQPPSAVAKLFEAFDMYDGAAQMQAVHFNGFTGVYASSRLLSGVKGAALKRTNHKLMGCSFYPLVSSGVPRVQHPDCSGAPNGGTGTDSNPVENKQDPRFWGGSLLDCNGALVTAGASLVSNHEWFNVSGRAPYGDPLWHTYSSAFKVAHLMFSETNLTVSGVLMTPVNFTRSGGMINHEPAAPLSFLHNYDVHYQHRQIPVFVNAPNAADPFHYRIKYTSPGQPPVGGNVPLGKLPELSLRVDRRDAGESVLLELDLNRMPPILLPPMLPDEFIMIRDRQGTASTNILYAAPIPSDTMVKATTPGAATDQSVYHLDRPNMILYIRVLNLPPGFIEIDY